MLKLEPIALELFEYKVEDIRAKRSIRGGVGSAWELYNYLNKEIAVLSADERKRLEQAGRMLRRIAESPKASRRVTDTFSDLVLGDLGAEPSKTLDPTVEPVVGDVPADPAIIEELAILKRLANRAWWKEMDNLIQRIAASLRAERDRYTARLLYATMRNINHYSKHPEFASDLNLANFVVKDAIPEREDPLLSLNDLDGLGELVKDVIDLVLNLTTRSSAFRPVELPESQSLDYVRRVALAVARDPYAGRQSLLPPKGPTSAQLRMAIQELGKERLRDDQRFAQRQELEQRLQAVLAFERNQRQLFQRDVESFTVLVNAFFDRLAKYLPMTVGGQADGPQLDGGVLFAVNPALRWDVVPANTTALTVHIKGPVRFNLGGIEVAVMGHGAARGLFINGTELTLKPRMTVRVGRRRLLCFHEGNYLHLKLVEESRSLALQVAEALAIHYVLVNPHRDDLLTVLKIAANTVVGEPQELVGRAIEHIGALSTKAPSRRQAIEGFIRGSAKAAAVIIPEHVVQALVQRFHTAMTVSATDLSAVLEQVENAESAVYQLTGEPLSIDVAGFKLTVRQYRGRSREARESLVVMLPGQPLGSFTDYLLEPLGDGTLMCVRGEQELAVIYVRNAAPEASQAAETDPFDPTRRSES